MNDASTSVFKADRNSVFINIHIAGTIITTATSALYLYKLVDINNKCPVGDQAIWFYR